MPLDAEYLNARLASAPILDFDQIPVDWGDMRFLVRATAAAMRHHEALEDEACRRAEGLSRDGDRLLALAKNWYESVRPGTEAAAEIAGLDNVLLQSMRPFLTRAAEAIMARIDFAGWQRGTCPLCFGEPDLAVITPAAERVLICARCNARWRFHQLDVPVLSERRSQEDHVVRQPRWPVPALRVRRVHRYIKAYDARQATRPVLPGVDGVATLPLDAAAMQKGYK